MKHAVILVRCPDQKGIVARISDYVFRHDANIITADQYSTDPEGGTFFLRLEFCYDSQKIAPDQFERGLAALAGDLGAEFRINYLDRALRMGLLVSKEDHCLFDLFYRWHSGEINVLIPLVISNHRGHAEQVRHYGVAFEYVSAGRENRPQAEKKILELVKDSTDFLVLARYMQILSPEFLASYGKDIINIHHSFLPSFKGANPYQQAYDRGVKIIGATAHYVTSELDEGPIIEQMVEPVSHRDGVQDLMRKGRNLEKIALAKAVHAHAGHRVIKFRNKTIVFG